MLQRNLVIAGLVLFAFAVFTFTPIDGVSAVQEAGAAGVALAVAMLL